MTTRKLVGLLSKQVRQISIRLLSKKDRVPLFLRSTALPLSYLPIFCWEGPIRTAARGFSVALIAVDTLKKCKRTYYGGQRGIRIPVSCLRNTYSKPTKLSGQISVDHVRLELTAYRTYFKYVRHSERPTRIMTQN